jgi:hypothetical protein
MHLAGMPNTTGADQPWWVWLLASVVSVASLIYHYVRWRRRR